MSKKQKKKRKNNKKEEIEKEEEGEDNSASDSQPDKAKSENIQENTDNTSELNVSKEQIDIESNQVNEKLESEKVTAPKPSICKVCNEEFPSRTKLFEHISKEGHAATKIVEHDKSQPLSHNAMKKIKKLAKAKK